MFWTVLKAFLLGAVEGITEWLPISSTGHMILFDEFVKLEVSSKFRELFFVVIQLGAILAVCLLYRERLFPFGKSDSERRGIVSLWIKIFVASVPAAILGFLLDDWLDAHLYNYVTVAVTLIVYGLAFILIERKQCGKAYRINSVDNLPFRTALGIGCFQVLSLIPGTSRSGSTILGAMLLGVSRTAAAEFSFFLAIPVMFGASGLKIAKYALEGGVGFTSAEWVTLMVGVLTAFFVSLVTVRFLVGFVRGHSFAAFGWYRIALGAAVLLYFGISG